jgi:hypothetical protein
VHWWVVSLCVAYAAHAPAWRRAAAPSAPAPAVAHRRPVAAGLRRRPLA